ncbi:hypothetical protein QMM58_12035 [Clostridioides difficile]|nr:hypothetical protein [Clostridioides difficile]
MHEGVVGIELNIDTIIYVNAFPIISANLNDIYFDHNIIYV